MVREKRGERRDRPETLDRLDALFSFSFSLFPTPLSGIRGRGKHSKLTEAIAACSLQSKSIKIRARAGAIADEKALILFASFFFFFFFVVEREI